MSTLFVKLLLFSISPLSTAFATDLLQASASSDLTWFSTLLILLVVIFIVWALIIWNASQPLEYTFKHSSEAHIDAGVSLQSATEGDNLEMIEGIGPKIAAVFRKAGLNTFAQLAEKEPESLEKILKTAGIRLADPGTWPQQAALADAGLWEDLERLQSSLKGGR